MKPISLGLTGSIGMGKSATAQMFRDLGVPVYDADLAVHELYARGGRAVAAIAAAFPDAVGDGAVDRAALSRLLAGDPAAWKRLEAIVHPLVAEGRAVFLRAAAADGADLVVLDIPLLFETGGEGLCDYVLVVSARPRIQRGRVLARPDMSPAKFNEILARQMPDGEKRKRADFVIATDHGLEAARRDVAALVDRLRSSPPPKRANRKADDA